MKKLKNKLVWLLAILALVISASALTVFAEEITENQTEPETAKVAKVGTEYFADLQAAIDAAQSGDTIILKNREYDLPIFSGKELTFKGESKDGVIINDAPDARTQGWIGSTFHFENLTAKGATANYHGLANGVVAVTYKDCNINGLRFLYANDVTFETCAFDAEGVEHSFWTYGASNVTVNDCIFKYTDRAVNCYSENGANHEVDITFSRCTFTYVGTFDAPEGAVEINSGSVKSIELTMDDCTAPASGDIWFNSQWDSNKGRNTVVTVVDEIVWQVLPVATIGETKYYTLDEALAAAKNGDIVTIMPGEYAPINISNKNITLQGTVGANGELLTTIKGGNPAITGHGFNGTIKDLKIVDAWKVMYAEPAGNMLIDNVYVTGATYGFHLVAYSAGLTWTIQNSYMNLAWANSLGVYGDGDAEIIIKGNTFEATNPYYTDGDVLHVNSFLPNVTVTENVFGENAKIRMKVTDT